MITSRRRFLRGLFVAPAIVSVTNIMPVKAMEWLTQEPQLPIVNGQIFDTSPYYDNYDPNPDYKILNYKAGQSFDAGMFYAPYVPLQIADVRKHMPELIAHDILGVQLPPELKQFKTRYGITEWPTLNANSQPLDASQQLIQSKVQTR